MNYMEVLAATFSTFFFGVIFSLTGKKLFYSSFAGGLGWYTHLLFFKELVYSKTASYVVSAMIIAIFSEIISRLKRTTVTTTLIPALIPLVPGGGIYYTMSFFVENRMPEAFEKGRETIFLTVALSVGIFLISTFSQILNRTIKYTRVLKKYRKFKEYKRSHKV